jgi:hypothetical protein
MRSRPYLKSKLPEGGRYARLSSSVIASVIGWDFILEALSVANI